MCSWKNGLPVPSLLNVTQHAVELRVLNANLLYDISRHWIPGGLGNHIALKWIADDAAIRQCAGGCGIVDLAEDNGSTESVRSHLCSGEGIPGVKFGSNSAEKSPFLNAGVGRVLKPLNVS